MDGLRHDSRSITPIDFCQQIGIVFPNYVTVSAVNHQRGTIGALPSSNPVAQYGPVGEMSLKRRSVVEFDEHPGRSTDSRDNRSYRVIVVTQFNPTNKVPADIAANSGKVP